jgi:hypothetical protein
MPQSDIIVRFTLIGEIPTKLYERAEIEYEETHKLNLLKFWVRWCPTSFVFIILTKYNDSTM